MTEKKKTKAAPTVTVYSGGKKSTMKKSEWLESKKVEDGNKSKTKS